MKLSVKQLKRLIKEVKEAGDVDAYLAWADQHGQHPYASSVLFKYADKTGLGRNQVLGIAKALNLGDVEREQNKRLKEVQLNEEDRPADEVHQELSVISDEIFALAQRVVGIKTKLRNLGISAEDALESLRRAESGLDDALVEVDSII